MTKTRKVAGHKFNLICGHRYLATRPFATARRNEKLTVAIIDISN